MRDVTFCVGGPAGKGIKTVGYTFGLVMLRHGYFVYDNDEYPSLIKGGHNVLWSRISDERIFSHDKKTHILLALDKPTVLKHQDSIEPGGFILFDEKHVRLKDDQKTRDDIHYIPLPLLELAQETGGSDIMFNTVGLSVAFAIMGSDLSIYFDVLKDQFEHKGKKIVSGNQATAKAGYDLGLKYKKKGNFDFSAQERSKEQTYLLTGNQAISYGAVNAGCNILCSYPMTPASAVMDFFGQLEHSHNVVLKHVEDELAALNMAIGAWHAGTRSMVATSGGGFALMAEALGFAGITEAGPVIFIAQRPGPATGIPTFTCQSDLRFALHAGQDEFPRVIISPGDPEECFYLIQEAFNLGDRFQTPVIVLSDKFLSESHFTTSNLDDQKIHIDKGKITFDTLPEDYKRYEVDEADGVSLRSVPGTPGNCFLVNSYEHDEHGYASEDSDMRIKQVEKRHRKQLALQKELPLPTLYGESCAKLTLICWGSTKMVALEAMRMLALENIIINVLHFSYIYPLNWELLKNELDKYPNTLFVEANHGGLMEGVLKQYCGFEASDSYHKIDGRPFYPEELVSKVYELSKK